MNVVRQHNYLLWESDTYLQACQPPSAASAQTAQQTQPLPQPAR